MQKQWPYRLLAPGPVPIPQKVLEALARPPLHHRTPQFQEILKSAFENLQKVFETTQPVLIQTCTGTGAMESAVVNTLSPGDEAVCVNGGKFGERWGQLCRGHGIKAIEHPVTWGKKIDLKSFEKTLRENPQVKAVFTQACETSTATVFPIQEMAALTKKHTNALMIVDAITAMGCMDLPMDAWSLDVVVAGSQKAFMLPTGMGFIGISLRAQEAMKKSTCSKYYFDWAPELKAYPDTTRFSSPNSMIIALDEVLKIFRNTGMAKIKNRCARLAQATRAMAESLDLTVYSEAPSPSLTAVLLPEETDGAKLRQWLEDERNITVMGGQDQLKGKILRIGHMGAVSNGDMMAFFETLGESLKKKITPEEENRVLQILQQSEEYFL